MKIGDMSHFQINELRKYVSPPFSLLLFLTSTIWRQRIASSNWRENHKIIGHWISESINGRPSTTQELLPCSGSWTRNKISFYCIKPLKLGWGSYLLKLPYKFYWYRVANSRLQTIIFENLKFLFSFLLASSFVVEKFRKVEWETKNNI